MKDKEIDDIQNPFLKSKLSNTVDEKKKTNRSTSTKIWSKAKSIR